jgi:hypothetical protein
MNSAHEQFTGVVDNVGPSGKYGWIHTDAGETLFFHLNYTRRRKIFPVGALVRGIIVRRTDPGKQDDRAMKVEAVA